MFSSRLLAVAIATVFSHAFAQPLQGVTAPTRPLNFETLVRPPIPVDPLEIVTSAQAVANAQQRLDAIALLRRAQALSNVRAQAYDLKTSFVSVGNLPSDGAWTLEDISPASRVYRWTARGPNYSAVYLYPDATQGMLYGSNDAPAVLPLRLAEVRQAIFGVFQIPGAQASIRTAAASLNGHGQSCVLVAMGAGDRTFTGAREWQESEYCMDAATGLLSIYSPVPGVYVRYDYSSALKFHNAVIPGSFTIAHGGRNVIEARTLSVSEPPDAKDPMFSTNGLTALGVGRVTNPMQAARIVFPAIVPGRPYPTSNADAVVQMVELHANLSLEGRFGETEILTSTDASLNQAALDQINKMNNLLGGRNQPGATQQSGHIFLTIEFVTRR